MPRAVWMHFLLALALLAGYDVAWAVAGYVNTVHHDSSLWQGIVARFPFMLQHELPVAAGVALSTLTLRAGAMRSAILLAGATLLLMVGFDALVSPRLNRAEAVRSAETTGWPLRLSDTTGVLQRELAFLRGKVTITDVEPRWPPPANSDANGGFKVIDNPDTRIRIDAVRTAIASLAFLLPFITCGLVLGLVGWTDRHVSFRPAHMRVTALVLLAWVLVLYAVHFMYVIPTGLQYYMQAGRRSMWWMLAPVVPLVALAGWGWKLAAQVCTAREF